MINSNILDISHIALFFLHENTVCMILLTDMKQIWLPNSILNKLSLCQVNTVRIFHDKFQKKLKTLFYRHLENLAQANFTRGL